MSPLWLGDPALYQSQQPIGGFSGYLERLVTCCSAH